MAEALGGIALLALCCYALTGGADYGGGVWDLLASGPRAAAQRELISDAIGPIWEANHVWLILVIVILFTAFPTGFAVIATALHIPLTLMLVGIVLRGSAFTFRSYSERRSGLRRRWGAAFAIASLVTPVLLGVNLGALGAGGIVVDSGRVVSGFVRPWLGVFPFAVGVLALALFAYLAAVYLALAAAARPAGVALAEDFRRRALGAWAAAAVVAALVLVLSGSAAPELRARVAALWPLQAVTLVVAGLAGAALWRRRYRLARAAAAGQVAFIVLGWGLMQYPYLVVPGVQLQAAAAPPATLRLLLIVLGLGVPVLVPSFVYLYRVFQSRDDADPAA
jgi:cytochrome d ubiquinol oxidase subunit II